MTINSTPSTAIHSHVVSVSLFANEFSEEEIHRAYRHLNDKYARDYIWQNERLRLKTTTCNDFSEPDCQSVFLQGFADVGECLDDEWLITFMMVELSRLDIIVQVSDTDGDYLLIEAAGSLPLWITPENSKNRAFLYQGLVHIIPLSISLTGTATPPGDTLDINEAIRLVRSPSHDTVAPKGVQQALLNKISCYPKKALKNNHYAQCILPHRIAHYLNTFPKIIAQVVGVFYNRDPILLKACHKMTEILPSPNVKCTVRFSKMLYAQIKSQKFFPPKSFQLPPLTSPDFPAAELGMKLTCGFEMLLKDLKRNTPLFVESDPQWQSLHKTLYDEGYFHNLKADSEQYQEMEHAVKCRFQLDRSVPGLSKWECSLVTKLDVMFKTPLTPFEELDHRTPDSDAWLDISEQQVDGLLAAYNSDMNASNPASFNTEKDVNLENVASSITSFVKQMSGVDGAEFPAEFSDTSSCVSDFQSSSDEAEDIIQVKESHDRVNFDGESFLQIFKEILDVKDDQNATMAIENIEPTFDDLMNAMDAELAKTKIYSGFEKTTIRKDKKQQPPRIDGEDSIDEDDDNGDNDDAKSEVNVELNLVKNILESFSSQHGLPGPASNILGRMGIQLPGNKDLDEK